MAAEIEGVALPGPRGWPLVGVLPAVARRGFIPVMEEAWRRYGDLFELRVGASRVVIVAHPEGVERVLRGNRENYVKGPIYDNLRVLLGEGLATVEGPQWRVRRRQLQPAFHGRRIRALVPGMIALAERTLEELRARAPTGGIVDVSAEMSRLTFRMVGQGLFGLDLADQAGDTTQAIAAALEELAERGSTRPSFPLWAPTPGNLRLRRLIAGLDAQIAAVVAAGRAAGDRGDLLGALVSLRDAGEIDDRELRDEILTMFLAGYETVALTLGWCWYLLADEPAVQARIAAEAADGGASGELRYTRMVIDEVLRVRPTAWIVARDVREDDVVMGRRIRSGSIVLCAQYLVHRHPEFWREPERFNPDRWDRERPELRHDFAYFPFSKGPRVCIGADFGLTECQVVVATMARALTVSRPAGGEVGLRPLNNLRPDRPIRLAIRWR
ncbi:MAG: cytochrome P450 [Nannocystis sp.]|nr:cytochrome P450 [Nannocystis sp.]